MLREQKTGERRRRTRRWIYTILAVTAAAAVVADFALSQKGRAVAAEPTIPHSATLASWNQNGQNGKYLLEIVKGDAPASGLKVLGVVATDTTCEPDAQGFSHCHNVIDLANGARITVIDTHRMSQFPCLSPGEALWLTSLDPSRWVVATRS